MKILVVSDTHGSMLNLRECISKTSPIDMLVHCGDVEGQENDIREAAGCECHIVSGNNDYFSLLPREEEFMIGDYRAFLTHGHSYGVSIGYDRIVEEAVSRGADIVFCGHTHKPKKEILDGVRVYNPGSLSYPRQEGRRPSYMTLEFDRHGQIFCAGSYL